jgi:hypothetical protein
VSLGLPHKEEQISGRSWAPVVDQHDRLSGKLQFSFFNAGGQVLKRTKGRGPFQNQAQGS